jgi:hypothetical protein
MTIKYRYIGIFQHNTPPDRPAGLVRVWTDAGGEQREELFRSSLTWEPSEVFDPMARPDDLKYIEVDETIVASFIEQMRQRYGGK